MKNWIYIENNKELFKDAPEWAGALVEFNGNRYFVESFENLKEYDRYQNMSGSQGELNPGMFKSSSISFELIAKRVDMNDSDVFWDGRGCPEAGMICKLNTCLPFYTPGDTYKASAGELVEVGGTVKFNGVEKVVVRLLNQKYNITSCIELDFLSTSKTEEQLKKDETKAQLADIVKLDVKSDEIEALYQALKEKSIVNM